MMGKYFFFGEFGFLHMHILPALELFFERNPGQKLILCTYPNYGLIIKNHFADNITITEEKVNLQDESRRQALFYYDESVDRKMKSLGYDLIYEIVNHYDNMFELHKDNEVHFGCLPPSKYQLKRKLEYNVGWTTEKFINIFPRNRKGPQHSWRNVPLDFWKKVLQNIDGLGYRIVVHGLKEETMEIKNDQYIYPFNALEQIMYLNNSLITITPDSGFYNFAVNCGSDIFVLDVFDYWIRYNPFKNKVINVDYKGEDCIESIVKAIKGE